MCVHNYYFLLCCFLAVRMAADLPLSKANNCQGALCQCDT